MKVDRVLKYIGLGIFSVAMVLTFGFESYLDYKAWMFVIGSAMYATGVEQLAKLEKGQS
jgi:hypothetical protein